MKILWLRILAALGDREARKSLNRSAGARKAAITRRQKRTTTAACPWHLKNDPETVICYDCSCHDHGDAGGHGYGCACSCRGKGSAEGWAGTDSASLNVITERTTVSRRGEPVLDDRD